MLRRPGSGSKFLRSLMAVVAVVLLQLGGVSAANAVTRCGKRVSNMKAIVPSSLCGFSSALLALSNASTSGPCGSMVLCRLNAARHEAAAGLGVVHAVDQAHELAHDVHVVPGRPERVLRHQPAVAGR